jgi:hypothetical protein
MKDESQGSGARDDGRGARDEGSLAPCPYPLAPRSSSLVPPPSPGRRYFLDSSNGRAVGFVSQRPRGWPTRILSLIRPCPACEVHEMEDESLLCSYTLGWLPAYKWRVVDADEQLVGWLKPLKIDLRPSTFDLRGEIRGAGDINPKLEARSSKIVRRNWILTAFHSPNRILTFETSLQEGPTLAGMFARLNAESTTTEIGSVARNQLGIVIRFLPVLDSDPLAKMLLLVAVLVSFPDDT